VRRICCLALVLLAVPSSAQPLSLHSEDSVASHPPVTPGPDREAWRRDVAELLARMRSADARLAAEAYAELQEMAPLPNEPLVALIATVRPDGPAELRMRAIRLLGHSAEPHAAAGELARLLADGPEADREAAAAALGTLHEAGVPHLLEALRSLTPELRASALRGLAHAGPAAAPAVPELIGLLQRELFDPMRAVEAADVLGQIGDGARAALPALAKAFDQAEHPAVRCAAASAMARLGAPPPGAVDYLLLVLRDPAARLRARAAAARALADFAEQEAGRAAPVLQAVLAQCDPAEPATSDAELAIDAAGALCWHAAQSLAELSR
jgi:hypothetical protein